MYEFKPATERILHMRQLVRDRVIRVDTERVKILTECYKKYDKVPPIIKMPLTTLEICKGITCRCEDFDLIVGSIGQHFLGCCIWPEWESQWLWRELAAPEEESLWELRDDGLYHRTDPSGVHLSMSRDDIDYFLSVRDYWEKNTFSQYFSSWQPDGYDDCAYMGINLNKGQLFGALPTGHLVAGYDKIINVGYGAIRKQATDWIEAHKGNLMGYDMNKFMFYKSAQIICDAAITLIKRQGQVCAEKAAECTDPKRKAELEMMADGLEWISENPARTFWEACQAAIMYQLLLYMDCRQPALAFGRFDQYTWPFLEKDLAEGRLTMDEAQEIVDAFFLRSNCFYRASDPGRAAGTGVGVTYHHTTIGGVDPNTGEDATNPVTYMVLETVGRLLLHDPTISLRINKNTPQKLWECAVETSRLVGGLPLFQNDEVIIPNVMRELGFSLYDARNYGIIGCQEIVGCGNDWPCGNGLHVGTDVFNHASLFLAAINNGVNPLTKGEGAPKTGYLYDMKSMDEVRKAVVTQYDFFFKWGVTMQNYVEYLAMWYAPQVALSISIEGCMEKGLDVACGGAKYNSYGDTATGLATIADSLTTIKYMCFDNNFCTTRELYDAVMANWEGYEDLRERILNEVPHYGNDDPYADCEMKWITDLYYKECSECYSTRTNHYKAGLYGAATHVMIGAMTWATPDGRKAGTPIADATSPAQGRDKNGPLAVFNSTVCFDHGHFMDGIALNIRIHPSAVNTEEAKQSLINATKAYFEKGGMEVQYNIVSAETMRAAQKKPEAYRDLVVRIAGYSAYFNELTVPMQNDVISRTENTFI
ncbi:MAG: hypothetical protein K5771_08350 [Oscillospiraceae bacterium]|nr:hypothetical protein [Oscillospiraceae bacterium]